MQADRYFGSESCMSKALNERGELTKAAKEATRAAYEVLETRMPDGQKSQAAIGQALGGFTQAGMQKASKGMAGRTIAEAIATRLGLTLDEMVATYGPPSPEFAVFLDPRYPNLEKAAAVATAEFARAIEEVFQERGQRSSDAPVDEWVRAILARHSTLQKGTKATVTRLPDVGGKPDMPWKKDK